MEDGASQQEVPLLLSSSSHRKRSDCPGCRLKMRMEASQGSPPTKELIIIALITLASALPISSLFPYVYFMIRDFGIAKSDTEIATFAGYMGSSVMFGRFLTSAAWGMVADRYGRKPVLIIGTTSIVVLNTIFGFSTNFWIALISRFLLGIWNAMLGTVSAYASEICSEDHQALGLSILGTMWGAGLIIGPAIGGYLAQPAEQYPAIFPSGSLFDRFPYALPSVCISVFAMLGLISSFYLPESLHNHGTDGDSKVHAKGDNETSHFEEECAAEHARIASRTESQLMRRPLWKNWGALAAILAYCLWGLHDMAYSEIFSLWAVSPKVYGGLEFTSSEVGDVLSISGAGMLLFQLLLFPSSVRKLGAVCCAQVPIVLTIPVVAIHPLMARISGAALWGALISTSILKNILSVSTLTATFILINNSVVNAQKGFTNGVAISLLSLFRAFAPAGAGALMSWSENRMQASFLPGMWMVFFVLDVLCFIALIATLFLPGHLNKPLIEEKQENEI